MVEMHCVLGAALAHRAQSIDIAEHIGERYHCIDDPRVATTIHSRDLTTAAVQVADDITHVLLGRHHFDPHDRLEKFGPTLDDAVLEGSARCDLECEHARINFVMCAVEQHDLQIDNREAGEHARL